jgi:hypothetical protein
VDLLVPWWVLARRAGDLPVAGAPDGQRHVPERVKLNALHRQRPKARKYAHFGTVSCDACDACPFGFPAFPRKKDGARGIMMGPAECLEPGYSPSSGGQVLVRGGWLMVRHLSYEAN